MLVPEAFHSHVRVHVPIGTKNTLNKISGVCGAMGMDTASGLNFQVASSSLTKTIISVDFTNFKQCGYQKKSCIKPLTKVVV